MIQFSTTNTLESIKILNERKEREVKREKKI